MKKSFIIVFLWLLCLGAAAQNISVKSFKALPMDMTASSLEGKRLDQNGDVAALIKVMTTETGFAFEGGTLGIVDTQQRVGEIWVWVPRSSRKITILHQQLGGLRDYRYPIEIEAERTYEMVLVTGKVETIIQQTATEQFLVFNVTPKDAMVTVNNVPWPVVDGVAQKLVDFGEYEYRIEASDYHSDAGKVMVNDPDNKVVQPVTLKPAFGFLKIEGDNGLLFQSSIYIDNANGAEALRTAVKLGSGNHKVRVIHPKYKPYEKTVTIADNETNTLNVNLNANFSTVTLKVDDDAEIFVNNERKGIRSWTGDLEAGNYTIDCRKANHRPSSEKKTITENMSGETFTLQPPTPITGSLVVSSNPPMAKITIDGKQVGETPMRLNSILIGEHTLRLEKEGCAPLAKTITIEEGKTLSLDEKLDTGRSIMVKTDRSGDKIYVDGDFVGETPRETPLGFGHHTIRVVRNGVKVEKEVDVMESTRNGLDLVFEFGRLITISTDQNGDVVQVDGETVGTSPVSVDLPEGRHSIHAQRDKKYADKDIEVFKEGGETMYMLKPEKYGVFFVMANAAYSIAPQTSFGLMVGSVERWGWYASIGTNFKYVKAGYECASDGAISIFDNTSSNYRFTKEETMRLSVTAGAAARLAKPVCVYLGAGYGVRNLLWHFEGESASGVAKNKAYSHQGVAIDGGMMFYIGHFSGSLGVQTVNFGYVEAKIGLGINF